MALNVGVGFGNREPNMSYALAVLKPPVIGSKIKEHATLKASSKPREFYLHIESLDLETAKEEVLDPYFKDNNV